MLSGCLVGSEHPDPALDVPAKYSAARGDPEAALPVFGWWRGFRSSELSALMEEAQNANLDIAVAVAQILQADAQVRIAGAPLFPSIGFAGDAEEMRQSVAVRGSRTVGSTISPVSSVYNVAINASYTLDFWGKNQSATLAATETAVASRYNRDVVALTTASTVANTYFQVLAAQDSLRIARQNVASAERILDLVKQQFNAGTTSQLEVSQQESLVGIQRATIPPLEITLRQNTVALGVLLGLPPERFKLKGGSLSGLAIPRVTPGLPSELLVRRPDVRQAEVQLASSNFSVESARAAFFPTIQLTGLGGFQSSALKTLFTPGAWYYTLAANLTQPIFDGFLLQGQLDQARGVQLQFLQSYRKAVISAFSDVEKALIAIEQTSIQERLQQEVVRASRQAFALSEAQLRAGTVNLITTLQTQQTLFTAESTLVQVKLARLQAIISLYQALGGGWPERAGPNLRS
ncbi:efflux transporter outer membrane subunit [Microvirga sp. BT350]|uniref:Efflux transporter outer membrane subunit n=2 Tax=Microvirga alba TaxID=2791025 RepID=A0A931FLK2_9HYPH|nr:efflux transporter outer membrane subunit [Microvirga alba]